MQSAREYILAVTAAALICGIAGKLISKGLVGAVIKLLCGVYMAITVLSPLVKIPLKELEDFTLSIQDTAGELTAQGENSARLEMADIISQRTGAYILDKAESLDLDLTVQVVVSEDPIPVPCGVILEGSVSPYAKSVLSAYILENLGISREEQQWIS